MKILMNQPTTLAVFLVFLLTLSEPSKACNKAAPKKENELLKDYYEDLQEGDSSNHIHDDDYINDGAGEEDPEDAARVVDADQADPPDDEIDEDKIGDRSDLGEEEFDVICEHFDKKTIRQRLPDVVIIGARKGGTRALIEFMRLHPKIKCAGPEPHYFDNHFETKNLSWYIEQMPFAAEDQLVVEKTPGYFHDEKSPARLKQTLPKAKLLLILRDPVKRLLSDYNQFRNKRLDLGETDYPPFDEFVFTKKNRIDTKYPPLVRSIYHIHYEKWLEHFPKEQIHIVNGDKFIKEPWSELQKLESFLNLENSITEDNFFFNATKGFYCAKDRRVAGPWECVKRKCLSRSKGRPKPPVQPETMNRLRVYLAPFNRIFERISGIQFDWPQGDKSSIENVEETPRSLR